VSDVEHSEPPSAAGWLVLISFGFVLLATVLRVASVLTDGLTLVYASIACGALAAMTLVVAVRSRQHPKDGT
jgi:hypothetical protein